MNHKTYLALQYVLMPRWPKALRNVKSINPIMRNRSSTFYLKIKQNASILLPLKNCDFSRLCLWIWNLSKSVGQEGLWTHSKAKLISTLCKETFSVTKHPKTVLLLESISVDLYSFSDLFSSHGLRDQVWVDPIVHWLTS